MTHLPEAGSSRCKKVTAAPNNAAPLRCDPRLSVDGETVEQASATGADKILLAAAAAGCVEFQEVLPPPFRSECPSCAVPAPLPVQPLQVWSAPSE